MQPSGSEKLILVIRRTRCNGTEHAYAVSLFEKITEVDRDRASFRSGKLAGRKLPRRAPLAFSFGAAGQRLIGIKGTERDVQGRGPVERGRKKDEKHRVGDRGLH